MQYPCTQIAPAIDKIHTTIEMVVAAHIGISTFMSISGFRNPYVMTPAKIVTPMNKSLKRDDHRFLVCTIMLNVISFIILV